MKKAKVLVALLLIFTMIFTVALTGCSKPEEKPEETPADETEAEAEGEGEAEAEGEGEAEEAQPEEREKGADGSTPMVVGYSNFSAKFSPFFAESAYDRDVADMTQIYLLSGDRTGAIVTEGIAGQTIAYDGNDHVYHTPADLVITENADGTVFYDFTLRDDLVFSDGEPVTIDDVIFNFYVLADPTYDGSSTLYSVDIQGMAEYRQGIKKVIDLIAAAGPDNTDFTF